MSAHPQSCDPDRRKGAVSLSWRFPRISSKISFSHCADSLPTTSDKCRQQRRPQTGMKSHLRLWRDATPTFSGSSPMGRSEICFFTVNPLDRPPPDGPYQTGEARLDHPRRGWARFLAPRRRADGPVSAGLATSRQRRLRRACLKWSGAMRLFAPYALTANRPAQAVPSSSMPCKDRSIQEF